MEGDERPVKPKPRFVDTLKAVGWAFFGVRKGRAHEHDMKHLRPVHVILVGILLTVVFVVTLVFIARMAAG